MPTKKKVTKKKRGRPRKEPEAKPKRKTGRPRIEIDWKAVEAMCAIHCTAKEIVAVTGISEDTLERRCKETHGVRFADFIREKRGKGRVSLRRRQWQVADSGDKTMLIWLGKNWLKQTDRMMQKSEHSGTINGPVILPSNERDSDG
jgi:hypothetical protein